MPKETELNASLRSKLKKQHMTHFMVGDELTECPNCGQVRIIRSRPLEDMVVTSCFDCYMRIREQWFQEEE